MSSQTPTRPFDQQTKLERVLRSHLWAPQDRLERMTANLPKHVKKKEFKEAAECQECIREAESEIEQWEYILRVYEDEHQSFLNSLTDFRYSHDEIEAACGGELALRVRDEVMKRRESIIASDSPTPTE